MFFQTGKWQKPIIIAFFETDPGVKFTHSVILFFNNSEKFYVQKMNLQISLEIMNEVYLQLGIFSSVHGNSEPIYND